MPKTLKLKSDIFNIELSYILDERLRKNTKIILDLLPDYFYEVPATSSGKYHPEFAQGTCGLVRHTKVAVRIAKELLGLEFSSEKFTNNEKDLIIISILLHDALKSGLDYSEHTKFEHPLIIADFIKDNKDKTTFTDKEIKFISDGISSHMGEWNKSSYSKVELPKPMTKHQRFIHMCDYLSSKKFLDVKFDKENNLIS